MVTSRISTQKWLCRSGLSTGTLRRTVYVFIEINEICGRVLVTFQLTSNSYFLTVNPKNSLNKFPYEMID